jgi:hypothetical protein
MLEKKIRKGELTYQSQVRRARCWFVNLLVSIIYENNPAQSKHFKIMTPGRIFEMYSDSQEDAEDWVRALIIAKEMSNPDEGTSSSLFHSHHMLVKLLVFPNYLPAVRLKGSVNRIGFSTKKQIQSGTQFQSILFHKY